jgi:hypothetical protein
MRDRPSLNPSVKNRPGASLSYAQLLRAIGQAVDAFGLSCFELYNIGAEYILRSETERARKNHCAGYKTLGPLYRFLEATPFGFRETSHNNIGH